MAMKIGLKPVRWTDLQTVDSVVTGEQKAGSLYEIRLRQSYASSGGGGHWISKGNPVAG
jgi:hypothetical protein